MALDYHYPARSGVYIPISYTSAIAVSNNKKVGKVSFGATETEIPFELMQPK